MSSGNRRKRAQELLNSPFRPKKKKSRCSSPSPSRSAFSNTPANTLDTSNVESGSLTGASANALAGSASATGDQSQSLTILVSMKNEAFQKAIHKYIDNLSDDDKVAFQSATDVMEKLGELQQGKSRVSSSQMQKIQNLLKCVKLLSESVIICIQHRPQISSLVMGGLNCILTVSTIQVQV